MVDVVEQILSGINFDKEGTVVGKYYGKCPMCGKNRNLVFQRKNQWVCRKCYYK